MMRTSWTLVVLGSYLPDVGSPLGKRTIATHTFLFTGGNPPEYPRTPIRHPQRWRCARPYLDQFSTSLSAFIFFEAQTSVLSSSACSGKHSPTSASRSFYRRTDSAESFALTPPAPGILPSHRIHRYPIFLN